MKLIEKNKRIFIPGKENLYRRLSIRECARIQTFPDDFIFHYKNLIAGYKMVGNAVPCNLAYSLGEAIKHQIAINQKINTRNNLFKQSYAESA
jgi:DNA (cytosine-5)-methyltransferase 1